MPMNSFEWTFQFRFAIALALGFLIGLERESSGFEKKSRVFAGVRTFSLIALYGFGCGWLYQINIPFAIPVGMISILALSLVAYFTKVKEGHGGWTTEVAALITFIIGVLSLLTDVWVAMALGVISTILLSEKSSFEQFVETLDKSEFLAVVKFLLVTIIILPVLPDRNYTQFELNPTRVWQTVIMVSSIGFVGYFLTKKFGHKIGLPLSGLLGGIVSSTAVSIAVGRIAQHSPERSGSALRASLLASSVMYLRILVLIWILNPVLIPLLWWKFTILFSIGALLSITGKISSTESEQTGTSPSTLQNPFEIKPAIIFGTLFVILSVITMLVEKTFGSSGLLMLSAVVGVTDVDPFILSMVQHSATPESITISAIIIAMMSNTVIKGIYFGILAKRVQKDTFLRYGVLALLHLPIIIF
jgi:uncharacterized membrane protein (DUF4010 family)